MSDAPQGPGWWQASDLRWYPPEARPAAPPPIAGLGGPHAAAAPSQYGPYGPGAPPLPSAQNQATTSLVLGIAGLIPCWPFTLALALAAIVLGAIALGRIRRGAVRDEGGAMAVAGIVLGAVALAVPILAMVVISLSDASQYGLVAGPGA